MLLRDLPIGHTVAVDTEGSGLRTWAPYHARLSIVSWAFRNPITEEIESTAIPFDQGVTTPLGAKELPKNHAKRLSKWDPYDDAPNLDPQWWDNLCHYLSDLSLVMHNARHDKHTIAAGLRGLPAAGVLARKLVTPAVVWDTMLAQTHIDPRESAALKTTADRLQLAGGGEIDEKAALAPWLGPKTDPRYDLVPWSVIEPYAAKDAVLTLLLWEHQRREFEDDPRTFRDYCSTFDASLAVYAMERRGIRFNVERCDKAAELLQQRQADLAAELPFRGGNGKPTPPAAGKFFYDDADREPLIRTPTGRPKVDEEAIAALVRDNVPFAVEYAEHESVKSALSKWYTAWPAHTDDDGRLRPSYKHGTTQGGRLAAEFVNLMAIPHDYSFSLDGIPPVRDMIEPAAGHELWEVDVSQAEVRVGCAVARCWPLLHGFQTGVDAHSSACTAMFGATPDDPDWDWKRAIAKRLNLGIQYGAGVRKIREEILKWLGLDYPERQVREWVNAWKSALPEMHAAIKAATRTVETYGYVELLDGRRRYLAEYELMAPYKGFNRQCQFTVAHVMEKVMVRVEHEHPGIMLLQTHDSLTLELPTSRVDSITESVEGIMVAEFEKYCARDWFGEWTVVPFAADSKPFGRTAKDLS